MKTSGNTILITGSTSGIGLGLAVRFNEAGNRVIVAGRRKALLEQITTDYPGVEADLNSTWPTPGPSSRRANWQPSVTPT